MPERKQIDPTANVLALVEAANKRQDDLREKQHSLVESELRSVFHMLNVRGDHAREIREAEAKRIDAIRQVDVLAVSTAADRALAAIQALAATTASNAEALRTMVSSTATTLAATMQSTVQTITERIAALEMTSYRGEGKQTVADPQIAALLQEVRSLSQNRATNTGFALGANAIWIVLLGVAGLIFGVSRMLVK